ncbi:MAG: hypothetical protein JJE35_00195 [Thermoleophilia bacterium]|nr:hypothetical protein [Thermoleophilia bacterium]
MIPSFDNSGNLPPGIHEADWDELETRFNDRRRVKLFRGLREALVALREAGCRTVYIDGSFVTAKEDPGDFDACWEAVGVDASLLDPIFLDLAAPRMAQKERFGGELFPASFVADPKSRARFLDFFQRDRDGEPKGIIQIDLEGLT